MPKPQKSYPRIASVKDEDTKQALIEIWNSLHGANTAVTSASTSITASNVIIADLQSKVERLTKQVTIVAAGGGTAIPSTVGGGGSAGTSGGSGGGTPGGGDPPAPQPSDHPNNSGTVIQAKADLIAAGIDISGPCGAFQIVKLVAWRLTSAEPAIGLVTKDGGNNCDGYSTDNVMYNDGSVFDILGDGGGANSPQWNANGTLPSTRWSPPIAPAI